MQLPVEQHFEQIVVPAWEAYRAAEHRLTEMGQGHSEAEIHRAGFDALREGGAAAIYLHHFADVVWRARPGWLPAKINTVSAVREWLAERNKEAASDVSLLGDVADALKHAILTVRVEKREVATNNAVLVLKTAYGSGRYGEGKYGGTDQVIILAKSGQRALSSVLRNVIDAWGRVAGT